MSSIEARIYAVIFAGAVAFVNYWAFFDTKPGSEFLTMDFIPKQVRAGDEIKLKGELIRQRLCQRTEITRSMIDDEGTRYVLTDIVFNGPPGPLGRDVFRQSLAIPRTANPGPATIYLTTAWYCNPMQFVFGTPIRKKTEHKVEILPPRQ